MAPDPYKYFRIEAHEIVGDLGKGLLDLEQHADAALVARLLRLAHTLKGAARIVRHRELAELSHAMETALAPLRDAPVTQRLDAAFVIVDQMTSHLAALSAPVAAPEPAASGEPAQAPRLPRIDSSAVDDALSGLANVHALVGRLRAASDPREITRQVDHVDRELREVRRDVEHLRLSAAGVAFTTLERTARDAAVTAGKRVRFTGDGAEVRIDGQVLATLHGALVQLVRNAVAHGIETPADRAAAGKSPEGRISIAVRSLGRRISVTCEDDGRGLDLEAIQRAAKRRGMLAQSADAAELFQLLLRGGITTSREVTELSGRGIGLDVVREAAQSLGGDVSVKTPDGGGTAITLVVPVSLTASSLLLVECGDRVAAIPQTAIRHVARLGANHLVDGSGGTSIAFDDIMVPFAALAALLGAQHGDASSVVFIDSGEAIAAVGVDRVLGFEDTVVRSVPAGTPIDAIVWGVTLDAEGDPIPVLEPRALVAAARGARPKPAISARPPTPILVVDDSLTTRMLEQSILESAGFDVEVAASAEEALEKLARRTYALVLADVEMPGLDGFQLIAELRSRPALAAIPAILVTSRDAPADRRRGIAVGAQGYVVKSQFDQVELLAMIRKLVRA